MICDCKLNVVQKAITSSTVCVLIEFHSIDLSPNVKVVHVCTFLLETNQDRKTREIL